MSDLNSIETARPAFDAFTTLLGIMGDPTAYKANMEALQAKLAAVAEGEARLAAERAAFAAESEKARAEIATDRAKAVSLWTVAEETKNKADALHESAKAYAAKVGYWERPTSMAIGTGGIAMALFPEAPAEPEPPAPERQMIAEPFGGGRSGGQMVEQTTRRGGFRVKGQKYPSHGR
jgi:hypothetical protein